MLLNKQKLALTREDTAPYASQSSIIMIMIMMIMIMLLKRKLKLILILIIIIIIIIIIDLYSAKILKYSKPLYNARLRLQYKYNKNVSKNNTI